MKNEVIKEYLEKGLIRVQNHPNLPLRILNYTPKVQFERLWDEVTLKCRGLVVDDNGKIIAQPFPKFFNHSEKMHNETPDFTIQEKMDGSLGILFHFGNSWHLATRGSFTSEQAQFGTKLLEGKYKNQWARLNYKYTYCLEIIFPDNKIVVDYEGLEEIYLLGAFDPVTGIEVPMESLTAPFPKAGVISNKNVTPEELQKLNTENKEGFVIKFSNGERCKVKFDEYVRLHALISQISTKKIYEFVFIEGNPIKDYLDIVPDECHEWIRVEFSLMVELFFSIINGLYADWGRIKKLTKTRKDFANLVCNDERYKEHKSVFFKLYDDKRIESDIIKLIKPEYKSFAQ